MIFDILLGLSGIGPATARALVGGQERFGHATTATTVEKRQEQEEVVVTRLSTIYLTGNSHRPRTANPRFDIRVDLVDGLFGFCATTNTGTANCGVAERCTDSFSCSTSCGRTTDGPFVAWYCRRPQFSSGDAPYCSFNYLTLQDNVGPFTSLACGANSSLKTYYAFTTTSERSSMPTSSSSSLSSSPTSSSQESSSDSAASATVLEAVSQTTSPTATAPHDSASTSDSEASTARSSGSAVNTAAIVGGVVGRSYSPDYMSVMVVEAASRPMNPPAELSQVMMPAEMPGEGYRYN
ncbi:hypothetical protein VTG60DRAFT_4370 [Thermothelomyces hinnuleus]